MNFLYLCTAQLVLHATKIVSIFNISKKMAKKIFYIEIEVADAATKHLNEGDVLHAVMPVVNRKYQKREGSFETYLESIEVKEMSK